MAHAQGKKQRKYGRMKNREGHKVYNAEHRRERRKLANVLKVNGLQAAKDYREWLYERKGINIPKMWKD